MRLLLLFTLFLGACTSAQVNRVTQINAVTPAPERTPDEILSQGIDRVAKLAGLPSLKTANFAQGDAEIRMWYGFGLIALEGFMLQRVNNQWSAFHLKADHYSLSYAKKVKRIQLPEPKSGWGSSWQQLVDAGVLTLPNGTDGPDPDAEGFYVEVMHGGSYRNYLYNSPEYSEASNAKQMAAIGNIVSGEFGLARFKVTKPSP
jgi:hypothetical protein